MTDGRVPAAARAPGSSLAAIFPGQGSQRVGMGAQLKERDPGLFREHFGLADDLAGAPISRYALEGPLEDLTRTEIAQPAIHALSIALWRLARANGLRPEYLAGHSLGEFSAAVAGEALSREDGMALVCFRARVMAEAHHRSPGGMAAVIGLEPKRVAELCDEVASVGMVVVANVNAPHQVVTSGEHGALDALTGLAIAAGAEEVRRLYVGAAFHSPLMEPVRQQLAAYAEGLEWREPSVPLVTVAGPVTSGNGIRDALVAQTTRPVDWLGCVRRLRALGCETFLELGSGRVLTGLTKLIDDEARTFSADSPERVDSVARQLDASFIQA